MSVLIFDDVITLKKISSSKFLNLDKVVHQIK